MKNFRAVVSIIGILIVILIILLFFQNGKNNRLREQKIVLGEKIREARTAQIGIERIQQEIAQLNIETAQIGKTVPLNEEQPLSLIKELTYLANQSQLKDVEFVYDAARNIITGTLTDRGSSEPEDVSSIVPQPQSDNSAQIRQFFIEIRFEGNFTQVNDFLKKLFTLGRLVSVEGLRIKREEKILPRQKITLIIIAYSFLE